MGPKSTGNGDLDGHAFSFSYLIPNIFKEKKDPDPSIDSNLRQKSGTYENVVNRLVGYGAGDLLLEDEGREGKTASVGGCERTKYWVQSNL